MTAVAAATAALAMGCASSASAGVYSDDLSRCLGKATSSADRDVLVRWIFAAMANNASVKSFATITPEQHKKMEKDGGELFQRLLVTDCHAETVTALKFEGYDAIAVGFRTLGEVAMRGLTADPTVSASLTNWINYIDQDRLKAVIKEAGLPVTALK